MATRLEDHDLKEVGDRRRATLEAAGLDTLEALAVADPTLVASLGGFHRALAERLVVRAGEALRQIPVATAPEPPEPGAPRAKPSAGRARRHVKEVLRRVQDARKHAGTASARGPARKVRRSLRALRTRLQDLYARLLGGELVAEEWDRLAPILEGLDHRLERFLARRPRRARLKKLRKAAKKADEDL